MKIHIKKAAFYVCYFIIMFILLLMQYKHMSGDLNRLLSMGITVVLIALTFFLMKAYEKLYQQTQSENTVSNRNIEQTISLVYKLLEDKDLSKREQEVAWLIYRGYSNAQIAEDLFISENTVKKHASHVYEKLNVTGRKAFREYIKTKIG